MDTPEGHADGKEGGYGTSPDGPPRRRRRVLRYVLVALAVLPVVLVAVLVLLLQNGGISTRVVNAALGRANPWENATARVARAELSGLGRLLLHDLRVTGDDGTTLLRIDTLRARFHPLALIGGRLEVSSLHGGGIDVAMRQKPDSTWDLLAPFTPADTAAAADGDGGGMEVRISGAEIHRARLRAEFLASTDSVLRIEDLTVRLDTLFFPHPLTVVLDTVHARIFPPSRPKSPAHLSGALRLSNGELRAEGIRLVSDSSDVVAEGTLMLPDGTERVARDIDFLLRAEPLDFRDVGALVPGFDVAGSLRLDARVTGSTALLHVNIDGETFDGATLHLEGSLTPRVSDSLRYALEARVRGVDATLWSAGAPEVRNLDADVDMDLSGSSLGELHGSVAFDVSGALPSSGTLRPTRVAVTFENGAATFEAEGEAVPWAGLTVRGTARPFDSIPSYELDATVRQLEPIETGGTRLASGVARIEAEGTGWSPAVARGRASADLSGILGGTAVRGGSLTATWDSATARVRLDLPVGEGEVAARGRVAWGGPATRIVLESFDVERLAIGEVLSDTASGSLSMNGALEMVLGDRVATRVEANATVEQASWRELTVDTGEVSLRVEGGDLTGRARIAGPSGTAHLHMRGEPFASTPTWQVDSLRVRGLDLSALSPGMPASDLQGLLRLEGRGTAPAELSATGTLVVDSSTVGGSRVDGATLRLAMREGRVELAGDARALHGSLTLQGDGRPFESVPTFRIARLRFDSIRVDSTVAAPVRATLSGTLEADASLPRDTFPHIRGRLTLDEGRVNDAPLRSGTITFGAEGSGAGLDGTLQVAGGEASVRATADLARDRGTLTIRDLRAEGELDLPLLSELLGRDSVDSRLHARFSVSGGGGTLPEMAWSADLGATGHYGAARLDSLALKADLANGVLRLDTLVLASNVARGGGGGTVALTDSADDGVNGEGVHLRFEADSLDAVAGLFGVGPLTARSGTLQLDAQREAGALRITGSLATGGVITGYFSADTAHADFTAWVEDGRLAHATADAEGALLALPMGVFDEADGTMLYDSTGATFAVGIAKDAEHRLRMVGTAQPSDSVLLLDSLELDLPDAEWRLARPTTLAWGDRLDPGGLTLVSNGSAIELSGALHRTGTQDLNIRLDSVPLAGIADLVGMESVEGMVDGSVDVTGPAERPELSGELRATLNDAEADIALRPEGTGLGVDVRLQDQEGEELTIQGIVPFSFSLAAAEEGAPAEDVSPDAPLSLDLAANSFSLAWLGPFLEPMGVSDLQAELSLDGRLTGTLAAPELTGSARLAEGRLVVPDQGVSYGNIQGALAFAGDRIRVDSLVATSEGTVTLSGNVVLEPLNEPSFDLEARFRRFNAVHNAWANLRLTGEAAMTGALLAPEVTGSVLLESTDIYADPIGQGSSARLVTLTREDYRMLESYFGYRPSESAAEQRDLLETWDIEMNVDLGSDVWLRRRNRPELRVHLAGSLDVVKEPGDSIQLFGTVEALSQRSYFEQFGRRFAVSAGSVTFNGPMTDFLVTAQARYEVPSFQDPSASEVAITMDVSGSLNSLDLTLGSEPSMENADVLSYLATGRPAESATAFGEGTGGRGGLLGLSEGLAFGRLAGLVEEAAAEAVGLDVVEVRQHPSRGATLVAGRYVNPRLFVGFQQPLTLNERTDAGAHSAAQQTEVELEYTWFRWLLVNIQGGQSTLSLFFRTKWAF